MPGPIGLQRKSRSLFLPAFSAELEGNACAEIDPEIMFPSTEPGRLKAVAVCHECPVIDACAKARETYLEHQVHGVWNGVLYQAGVPQTRIRRGRPPRAASLTPDAIGSAHG